MTVERLRLLIVCTANQCRSPMGEAIARSLLYERSIASEVASAGTEALDGMEATDGAKITARKLALDRPTRNLLLIIDPSREGAAWLQLVNGVEAGALEALLAAGLIEEGNAAAWHGAVDQGRDQNADKVNKAFTEFEEIVKSEDRTKVASKASIVIPWLIAVLITGIALAGVFLNFFLIERPMSEIVGEGARIAGVGLPAFAAATATGLAQA